MVRFRLDSSLAASGATARRRILRSTPSTENKLNRYDLLAAVSHSPSTHTRAHARPTSHSYAWLLHLTLSAAAKCKIPTHTATTNLPPGIERARGVSSQPIHSPNVSNVVEGIPICVSGENGRKKVFHETHTQVDWRLARSLLPGNDSPGGQALNPLSNNFRRLLVLVVAATFSCFK